MASSSTMNSSSTAKNGMDERGKDITFNMFKHIFGDFAAAGGALLLASHIC